ncbi:MAG: dipeptidase E [Bacteroidetes bacterium GWE2_29_8]|nr:MAG: dipeptidase E [Bacteroidetes bacterium GWE2_29_8]
MKNLLLISNSTNVGESYLEYPKYEMQKFLKSFNVKKALFIPYAGVTITFDEYTEKVKNRFKEIGINIESIHDKTNPVDAAKNAEAIIVGGGNTFNLLKLIQENGLIEVIREKVVNGTPYIGWSAGSNLACPTIRTTNDMPIVQPQSFNAFNIIPFQINPHYLDANPDGHAGETREMRIEEFIKANQNIFVAGLREGCIIKIINDTEISLIGNKTLRIFKYGKAPEEIKDNLKHLLC